MKTVVLLDFVVRLSRLMSINWVEILSPHLLIHHHRLVVMLVMVLLNHGCVWIDIMVLNGLLCLNLAFSVLRLVRGIIVILLGVVEKLLLLCNQFLLSHSVIVRLVFLSFVSLLACIFE